MPCFRIMVLLKQKLTKTFVERDRFNTQTRDFSLAQLLVTEAVLRVGSGNYPQYSSKNDFDR